VPHSLISTVSERNPPTLWPHPPDDDTPTELAIEVWERENLVLKKLVVRLSEIILKTVISGS
jgi:hypothetical protein